eukprot:4862787-Karenia_brevis.AAC.1
MVALKLITWCETVHCLCSHRMHAQMVALKLMTYGQNCAPPVWLVVLVVVASIGHCGSGVVVVVSRSCRWCRRRSCCRGGCGG